MMYQHKIEGGQRIAAFPDEPQPVAAPPPARAEIDALKKRIARLSKALLECRRQVGEDGNPFETIEGIVNEALEKTK